MTNTVAIWLAVAIVAAGLADYTFNGGNVLFFLAQRFAGLIETMAFWR